MSIDIDIQIAEEISEIEYHLPDGYDISRWFDKCLKKIKADADSSLEVCIRYVDNTEIQQLNADYRNINKPTNILSFPADLPDFIEEINLLGDLVIAPAIIVSEAQSLNIPLNMHWTHIMIHGFLHLHGYDHQQDKEADIMENLEIEIMKELGFDNPYQH